MGIDLGRVDADVLQKVADCVVIKKHMRNSAIGSVIFGLINCAIGFGSATLSPLNIILGFIGIFLLIEGIYILATSNPGGMIADGIALIAVGIWNIIITISNMSDGGGGSAFWAILGVFQIYWGIQSFRRYDRFSHIGKLSVSPDLAAEIQLLIEEVKKGNPKKLPDMIQLTAKQRVWKGRLASRCAIMLSMAGDDIMIVPKESYTIERTGKAMIGSMLKVRVSMKDRVMDGSITPDHMERFETWKSAEEEEEILGEKYLNKDFGPGAI